MEVKGLTGLLEGLGPDGDHLLEQIRQLQRSFLSQRRNVGGNVAEFRQLLKARIDCLSKSPQAFPDSLVTVLYLLQVKKQSSLEKPVVVGMVSLSIIATHSYTEAQLFDLIVHKDYQQQGFSKRILSHTHNWCKKSGVSRAVIRVPHKHPRPFIKAYDEFGGFEYDEDHSVLVYRFKSEG